MVEYVFGTPGNRPAQVVESEMRGQGFVLLPEAAQRSGGDYALEFSLRRAALDARPRVCWRGTRWFSSRRKRRRRSASG